MKPKIVAIIQARTGSTRFPGKVFRPLGGIPMIEHIIKRIQQVPVFENIVLAVPDTPSEEELVALAGRMGIRALQGPEEDVLQRFILAGDLVFADQGHALHGFQSLRQEARGKAGHEQGEISQEDCSVIHYGARHQGRRRKADSKVKRLRLRSRLRKYLTSP